MKMKNLFRFCSLMLSWAVCANILAQTSAPVETPKLSVNAFSCDASVQFTIDNYDPSLTYSWTVNGNPVSAIGSTYTVASPLDGEVYKATVVAENNGVLSAVSNEVQGIYLSTPAMPQITTSHDCGQPITFKLNNSYPVDYVQDWKINNTTVVPQSGEYTLSTYSDRVSYKLVVNVTNAKNGKVCSVASVPEEVIARVSPTSPRVPNGGYMGCETETAEKGLWEDLVDKLDPSYTLRWYPTQNATSYTVPPVEYDKSVPGEISYWVSQVSPDVSSTLEGCESVGRTEVKVNVYAKPAAIAGADITICEGKTAVLAEGLTEELDVVYTWTPNGKLMSNNAYSVETRPLTTNTQFTLKVANSKAPTCFSEDQVEVKVLKKPKVLINPNKFTICEDGVVTIKNSSADPTKESYLWEDITGGALAPLGYDSEITLTSLAENKTIQLTSSLDELPTCSASATAEVTVIKRPTANAGDDKFVCFGGGTQIGTSSVTGVNYTWSPSDGLSSPSVASPIVSNVTADKQYTLVASSNAVANCTSTDEMWVYKVDKPIVYTLTGGGSYCQGAVTSGISIALSGSDTNTEYDLVIDGVAQNNWRTGENGVLEWHNVSAGTYRVKARKIGYNTCEEFMNGIVAVQSVPSPDVEIQLLNSTIACPGDEVTVRVKMIGGVAPYRFTLITNGVPETKEILSGNTLDFQYETKEATTFEVSEVSDRVCQRVYPAGSYPKLELDMANLGDFKIQASKANPVCYKDNVTLSINYNDPAAEYLWESGIGGNSTTITATQDHEYTLLVVTPQGCRVPASYELKVIQPKTITIGTELSKKTANDEYFLCSYDKAVTPSMFPSGGKFSSEPAGIIVGDNTIDPSLATATTRYEITYQHIDTQYGCEQKTTFPLIVSAVNKEVNWTLAPTNEDPKAWPTEFVKCQPDPANPKETIRLQGSPQVAAGYWEIEHMQPAAGGSLPPGTAQIIETDEDLAQAQMKDITAGIKYFVAYRVKDPFGCEGKSVKELTIVSNPTTYIESGGLSVKPGTDICINETSATIMAAQNPGKFVLSSADANMLTDTNPNGMEITIDPSKGKAGQHKVIFKVNHVGCSYSEEVYFNILNPVKITSFDLPKKVFCEGEDPVVIGVNATQPTTGEIEVINVNTGIPVLHRTNINNSPAFDPGVGEGIYKILYHYNDGTCKSIYEELVEVKKTPVIDFRMKSDYCYGEKISIVPNYPGGTITIDPLLPAETLVGNVFNTELSGRGVFHLDYEVTDENGCVGTGSTQFQVRGIENMSVQVDPYICEPSGIYPIAGFPKPLLPSSLDEVFFTTDPAIGLTATGVGTATIDLQNTTYNTTYPITYHYVEKYDNAAGVQESCETTVTEYFKVLDQTADFSGYEDGATICADVLTIDLKANIRQNTTFKFSHASQYPDAFVVNTDGTAILYPSKLPEGTYTGVTVIHEYIDPTGNLRCHSEKTKSFRISKIEEISDISLFCDPLANKTAVKIENAELGIRYDLYVDDAVYDSYTTSTLGGKVEFKPIDVPSASFSTVHVVAVEPNATACSRRMSKEYTVSPLHASVSSTNISCFGKEDGTFTGTVQGGQTPYSTVLYDALGTPVIQADHSIVLAPGKYEYSVTDAIGCTKTVPFEITEPNALAVQIQQTEVDCYGATTATINAQVLSNSGTSPYTYVWTKKDPILGDSEVSTSPSAQVGGGQYHIRIEDANKCFIEEEVTVSAPLTKLDVKLDYKVDVQVRGNATGEIHITASGGTPDPINGYIFKWSGIGINKTSKNLENLEDLEELVYGTYTVVVTDAKGCTASLTVHINEPTQIKVTPIVQDAKCNGDNNGVVRLDVTGGSTPYYITWKDAANTSLGAGVDLFEMASLTAGKYQYEIKDADGNIITDEVWVKENQPIVVTTSLLSQLENKCYGDENGVIILDIKGGTETYTVDWVGLDPLKLESSTKAVNLRANVYSIEVEDTNGCTGQHEVTITEPLQEFKLDHADVVENICHDGVDGKIDIEMQGGTKGAGYTYLWQGVGVNPTSEDQTGLKAGEKYTVIARDANNCVWSGDFELNNPQELTLSLDAEDIKCKDAKNGSIEATVSGEIPYTYTLEDPSGVVSTPISSQNTSFNILCENKGMYNVVVKDKLGCSIRKGVEINEPEELTARVEVTNISCNNANDGAVKVYAEGGSGIYTYALYEVGNTTPIATTDEKVGLAEGAYQYKVQDEKGCSWTSYPVIHIKNPDPITINYNVSNVTVYDKKDGIIDLDITGGTPGLAGYSIQWLDGKSIVADPADPAYNANKEIITNLAAGIYKVVVTDEQNCNTPMLEIEVTQPEVITLDIVVNDVRCHGDESGSIILSNIQGGDGVYTITVTDESGKVYTNQTRISPLFAGKYELKIVDSAGAELNKTIEVKQPEPLDIKTIPAQSTLAVDCFGNANGEITIEILGGAAPYEFDWVGITSGASTHNATNVKGLTAGTYSILLKDNNNCTYDKYNETIVGPVGKLEISETIVENKCYGQNNASIETSVSGGTAPYRYLWTGAGLDASVINNPNQYNLYNGESYTLTVIDALNCTQDKVYPLGERYEILTSTSSVEVKCNGAQKGELHATVSGGTAPLQYKWEKTDGSYSSTDLDIFNLYAGTYKFTVEDAEGCVVVKEQEITEPKELKAETPEKLVLCGGEDNGEIYVTVTGGTGPYEYKWYKDYDYTTEVGFGAHITNLGAGDYEIFIKDANGCDAKDKTTILSSVPISITDKTITEVSAYGGSDGAIKIQVAGGTPNLVCTWTSQYFDPNVPVVGTQLTRLKAGYYRVDITDAVGCSIYEIIEVPQPETIDVIPAIDDIKCSEDEGKIRVEVTGGNDPYEYSWEYPDGSIKVTQDPEITQLKSGVYKLTVTDASGTKVNRNYLISHKDKLTWHLLDSKTTLDCFEKNNANINLDVRGGTRPYTIKWTGPNFTKDNVQSIGNLGVGTYKAQISDANGCETEEFTQEITQPTEIKISETLSHNNCSNDKDGAIDIEVTGGIEPYSFTWSGFNVKVNDQDQTDLPKGTYYLDFKDANGCAIEKEYTIYSKNEINATISGPDNICSGVAFDIQIDVNGLAPWTIEYTDGTQIYTKTTDQTTNVYTHTLLADAEFRLISVVDANGCEAILSGKVPVDVHEAPMMTIVSAQKDCCLGEPALVDIVFSGKGPWTIHYTDGNQTFVGGPFVAERGYLEVIPTAVGTKNYTIQTVSNDNCTVPVDYSMDVTAYTYPNLEVTISPYTCEPNPLQVSLHATGETPLNVVYFLNDLKYEHVMNQEDETIEIFPNKPDNKFLFESITSGTHCVTKLNKDYQAKMGLLPADARTIIGQNMVCRNSIVSFSTLDIDYADSYKWTLPEGFTIVSGLGSSSIQVEVSNVAKDGTIKVWGVNDCGEGVSTSINVQVDKPMSIVGAEISIPPYVCDDETVFPLSVSEVVGATNYEWVMPTGYKILSGQGTRSIMVQIDKYALTNIVSVIPSNICAEADPVKAKVVIRPLPLAEAGVDFITDCSDEATLKALENRNAVTTEWRLVSGNAEFSDVSIHNSDVAQLMYGDNILAWNVDDGYCVGYDYVKVTNQNPGITDPEFSELTICEDYMTLRATKPEFGMGRWTLIAGDGEIQNPNSNETLITGLSSKRTNIIRWEVYSPQCSNTVNVEVVSHDLSKLVDAGSDGVSTTGSFRLSARVVNDSDVTGTWTVEAGAGTIEDPHNPNTVVTGLATGINTLRWTLTGYDCVAYEEIKIRMVDEPIASFNMETTEGCVPLTVQFTNTTIGNAEYKWEFGDGSSSDLRSPIHIYEKPGTYTAKLTASANGRVDSFTGVVTVLPSPEAAFSVAERQLYVPNAEAHFYSETEGGMVHQWLFGDGGSSDKANPVYTYLEDGLYDVTYIVSDINLCSDTLVMEDYIKVGKDSYLVFPTAFTPNVEHSNGGLFSEGERRLDVFYPIGRNVDIYKLEIYSSWGNKVFESNDQYVGWDGYYLGKCAAQGIYLYKAEGRFKDGNSFQYSGNLMLIR